jgi:hypothetical protein
MHHDLEPPKLPPIGKGFAAWFAFCAVVGLGVLGVAAWAVITLVHHFAG